MKRTLFIAAAAVSMIFISCGEKSPADITFIEDIPTVQSFTDEPVSESDIKKIVKAGINSQSAMNSQPWHFTVITNKDTMEQISEKMKLNMPKGRPGGDGKDAPKDMPKDMPKNMGPKAGVGDSPVAIVISGKDKNDFDAGLATQMMTVEAIALGYGTKIISSPNIVFNGPDKAEFQKLLDVPADMSTKAVILIGKYDQKKADAVTGATPRKSEKEIVTYLK